MANRVSVPPVSPAVADNGLAIESGIEESEPQTSSELVGAEAEITPAQRLAIESLSRGHSIKAAAKECGVARSTLYCWLHNDHAFRAVYFSWKAELQESARARLLSLANAAVDAYSAAIRGGDVRVAGELLRSLSILTPPIDGPQDRVESRRWSEMEKINRQATLMESENRAYQRRSSADSGRPYELQTDDQRNPEKALRRHLDDLKRLAAMKK